MRVLVCGGRDYADRRCVYAVLDDLAGHAEEIICGGANGADALARDWAAYRSIPCHVYNADWETHGRKAGPLRNQKMLDEGKPDLVIAFPGGRGTADMLRRAERAGVAIVKRQFQPIDGQ